MRSTLLALVGSSVLIASSLLIWPADVEAKGKWPMVWKGDNEKFWSKPFQIANRPGIDAQHQFSTITIKKKPGRNRCVVKFDYTTVSSKRKLPGKYVNTSQRPTTWRDVWWWDSLTNTHSAKLWMRLKVRTNGNCLWTFKLWGPRKGPPPEEMQG